MKVSEKQLEILRLINLDWEIGMAGGIYVSCWIQKGGLGRGGQAVDVHFNTFNSMRRNGLIVKKPNQHEFARPSRYMITDKGKQIVKEKGGE